MNARGRMLIGCGAAAAVLSAVVSAFCIANYIGAHSRYAVVGAVDSASGSRIEYTVSTHFHKSADGEMGCTRDLAEAWDYRPRPPAKLLQWVYKHVLGKPLPERGSNDSDPLYSIMQFTFKGGAPTGSTIDADGYVHLDTRGLGLTSRSEERITISNCPTTWYAFSLPDSFGAHNMVRYYCLLVRPKDKQITYAIVGVDDDKNSMGILGEISKIKESIKVVDSRKPVRP